MQPRPVAQRCLQQDEGAADVGVKERCRIVDRAVDMAFRCEMEDGIRVEIAKGAVHGAFVCDVGVHELVARRTHHLGDGFAPTGIGQFIDCEDLVAGAHSPAHRCRADEPGASGHDQPHSYSSGKGSTARSSRKVYPAISSCSSGVPPRDYQVPLIRTRCAHWRNPMDMMRQG